MSVTDKACRLRLLNTIEHFTIPGFDPYYKNCDYGELVLAEVCWPPGPSAGANPAVIPLQFEP